MIGFVASLGMVGAMALPVLFGVLVDITKSFEASFIMLALLSLLIAISTKKLKEP